MSEKFKVSLSWTEIHGAELVVEAESKEDIEEYLENNGSYDLRSVAIESHAGETFADFTHTDVDNIEELSSNYSHAKVEDDNLKSEYL